MESFAETDTYDVADDPNAVSQGADVACLTRDPSKLKVECICPKCQLKHSMRLHWIGRGTPRKFCNRCRDRGGVFSHIGLSGEEASASASIHARASGRDW